MIKLGHSYLWLQSKYPCKIMAKKLTCSHVVQSCTICSVESILYINMGTINLLINRELLPQNLKNGFIQHMYQSNFYIIFHLFYIVWQRISYHEYEEHPRSKGMMQKELYSILGLLETQMIKSHSQEQKKFSNIMFIIPCQNYSEQLHFYRL